MIQVVRRLVGDISAPGSVSGALRLDVLLELAEFLLDGVVVDTEGSAEVLEQSAGFPVELDGDTRLGVAELVERDYARVVDLAAGAVPRDTLVGVLLGDVGLELALGSTDLDLPLGERLGHLGDGFYVGQEVRELFELSPLVVRNADRNVDVDGFDYLGHICFLFVLVHRVGWVIDVSFGCPRASRERSGSQGINEVVAAGNELCWVHIHW